MNEETTAYLIQNIRYAVAFGIGIGFGYEIWGKGFVKLFS